MEVINLGNFGQKRPSPYAGMSSSMQEGLRTGAEQGKAVAELKSMQVNRSIELAKLQREVDKDQFTKEMQLAEHGKKVAEDLSMHLYTMKGGVDPNTGELGPEGKIFLKGIEPVTKGLQKTNPEYISPDGSFTPIPPKEIYKDQFYKQMTDAKNRILNDSYPKDPKSGQLTPEGGRQKAIDYQMAGKFNSASIDKASSILQDETLQPSAPPGSAQQHKNIAQRLLDVFTGGDSKQTPQPSPLSQGLAPVQPASTSATPMDPQAGVPQQGGGSSDNDPLGARSAV